MKQLLFFFLGILLIQGCGITGKTSRFTLDIPTSSSKQIHGIKTVDLDYDKKKISQTAIASYAWGKFNDKDAAVLKESIQRTVNTFNDSKVPQNTKLITVVRNHHLAASNSEGFIITCVAWALIQDNKVFFEEQFYASTYARMKALGAVKNGLNKKVVERIATVAKHATHNEFEAIENVDIEDIYFDYDEAIRYLPGSLTSVFTFVSYGYGYTYYSNSTTTGGADRFKNKETDKIDWSTYMD